MKWNHRILSHHGTPESTRDSSVPKQDSGWIGVVFASWKITIMPMLYFCASRAEIIFFLSLETIYRGFSFLRGVYIYIV
jgi:hypothetical protein